MKNSKFISKKGLPLLFTIVLFICTISCKKEKLEGPLSELPPSTQEGAHTFGCLINGKPWVAHLDPGVFTPSLRKITSNYSEPIGIPVDFSFRLVTTRLSYSDSTDQSFKFLFQPIEKNGKVDIDRLNQNEITFHTSKADGLGTGYQIYYVDTLYPINLEITAINTESNYISGLFDFRFVDDKGLDTLDVTEGRFDVRYQPY